MGLSHLHFFHLGLNSKQTNGSEGRDLSTEKKTPSRGSSEGKIVDEGGNTQNTNPEVEALKEMLGSQVKKNPDTWLFFLQMS